MDISAILALLVSKVPWLPLVLQILGTLVVLMSAYVGITKTQDDDAWFAKLESIPVLGDLIKALMSFSIINRK